MSQPFIDLINISKSYDGSVVLDDLNLSVKENTFVTLLRPQRLRKNNHAPDYRRLSRLLTPEKSFLTDRTSPMCLPTGDS